MIKKKKDNKGFTMIELIVVIAIIGIIGAILAPTYGSVTSSARLTTDLSTVKTVQQLVDLYYAEMGKYPENITELQTGGYIDTTIKSQTGGDIMYSKPTATEPMAKVQLNLSSVNNTYKNALAKLKEQDNAEYTRWIYVGD